MIFIVELGNKVDPKLFERINKYWIRDTSTDLTLHYNQQAILSKIIVVIGSKSNGLDFKIICFFIKIKHEPKFGVF